jgi:hypothetical protein
LSCYSKLYCTTVSDACGATTLTFADVTAAGSCAGNYTVTRTWTVTDACANTATASQVITVRDITPPTIGAAGANATIDCPATPNFTAPTVSDACGATTLTFADVTAAGCCAGNYTVTRTWTVTDACAIYCYCFTGNYSKRYYTTNDWCCRCQCNN